ncbi:tRNA1(Val) (adenine(37)-N6)-methyltransferase [Rhodopila sp.]|uniref:tRNA1(Val) (adenine(37)-N6)-methyltransferase n=1 Tax=Rhodopila sp. TaxID=2480087 RepID=UPI003D0F8814
MTAEARLLGGRVIHRQPATGFRSGIEPVLLAASVPARPNQLVLEAGTGSGAGLLCLNARVANLLTTGVEVDSALAELAVENARANGFSGIEILAERIETALLPQPFDHAFANPPYHAADGTASPDPARDTAKRGSDTLLAAWIDRLSGALRDRGSLTLIVPAARCPACVAAMAASSCPCSVLFPLWPKPGRNAKLVLLRGIKNARGTMRLAAGLVLHDPDGGFTQATQAILAGGEALVLDGQTRRDPAGKKKV